MMEVQPELIICYLELKFNTYDNSEPYDFDADSVMNLKLKLGTFNLNLTLRACLTRLQSTTAIVLLHIHEVLTSDSR